VTQQADMAKWPKSVTYTEIVSFILALNEKIKGKPRSTKRVQSPRVKMTVDFLQTMENWIKDIPPQKQAQRYGNKAFRTWLEKVIQDAPAFHRKLMGEVMHKAGGTNEMCAYFVECFGNHSRIDYGTGHELCFALWMAGLHKLGAFSRDDQEALVFDVFYQYLQLMRELQKVYWLEPAGSKGVWGLDDYQFLPLLWGAAQLIGHESIKPSSIHDDGIVEANADDYFYLSAIQFIKKIKSGLFAEHSPILNDISAVPTWIKVNRDSSPCTNVKYSKNSPLLNTSFLVLSLFLPFLRLPRHPQLQRRFRNK